MSSFLEFVVRHWVLVGLFAAAFVWLIIEESRHQSANGGARQSPEAVVMMMNHDNAVTVDLRDPNAFSSGHVAGSINVPFAQIEQNINKLVKYKQSPLVLVCNMGQHSAQAVAKLKKEGFEKIFILAGGLNAWKKANLPLMQK